MNDTTKFLIPKPVVDSIFGALHDARNPIVRIHATDTVEQIRQRIETERLNQLDRIAAMLRKHTQ